MNQKAFIIEVYFSLCHRVVVMQSINIPYYQILAVYLERKKNSNLFALIWFIYFKFRKIQRAMNNLCPDYFIFITTKSYSWRFTYSTLQVSSEWNSNCVYSGHTIRYPVLKRPCSLDIKWCAPKNPQRPQNRLKRWTSLETQKKTWICVWTRKVSCLTNRSQETNTRAGRFVCGNGKVKKSLP